MGQGRDRTLDVVRGIAILLVLAFHLRIVTGIAALDAALLPLINLGWVGVDLFFVLSGFLVGRMILVDAGRPAGLDRPRFFARRILRLWPTLYLYLAMLVATGGADGWRLVWPVMLHVQNYATDVPSHLWSLAVEEHFYLIAAIVLPALLHRTGHRGVGMALVAILAGCLALRLGALWFGEIPRHLQWQSQYRADSIAAGVLIAWAELYRPALIDRAARHRAACLIGALAGFAVLAGVADERFRYSIGLTIAWAASAAFVLAIYRVRIPAALSPVAGVLAWTGGIAYPLYIFHVSFGRVADAIALALDIRSPIAAIVWRYGIVVVGSAAIAILVERPLMRLRDRPSRRASRPEPLMISRTIRNKT